jgi:hypothetical protein
MYDHELIKQLRAAGWQWADIRVAHYPDKSIKQLTQAHSLWRKKQGADEGFVPVDLPPFETNLEIGVPGQTFARMESLEDVIAAFDMDPTIWEATQVTVGGSSWDQSVAKGTVASSVRIKASFKRIRFSEDDAQIIWDEFIDMAEDYAPRYEKPEYQIMVKSSDPVLAEIAIHDPHFGMYAYGKEVGGPSQDVNTISTEYGEAVEHLLGMSQIYPVDRILYIVGHDLQHINSFDGGKTGVTKRGTPQDTDTRISKIFTTIRKAVVTGIDAARLIAPTDIAVVPGNHDTDEAYKLGEVLNAWYRHDDAVDVQYGPNKRRFYNYGANSFMLTHGEEYRRKRDNLAMIMLTEMPTEMLVASDGGLREVHTGHNHIALQGGYYPTAEVSESRGVRVRSLPGMTATDAWHHEEGYKHHRAASLLVYRRSGGLVGLHEFSL